MKRSADSNRATPDTASGKSSSAARLLRFGVFEVDLSSGEIRRNGLKVTLPHQPFQILSRLLARPGEIVTREELRCELWADSTHVDFDHCLNTAVNKLREMLNDSAEKPRFIETVPKKGYRFVAPVSYVPHFIRAEGISSAEVRGPSLVRLESASRALLRRTIWLLGAMILLLVCAAGWFLLRGRQAGRPVTAELSALPGAEVTPALSPDGQKAVFAWNGGVASFNLYTKALNGKSADRLTSNPSDDFGPAYSPDARQIAFYRRSGDSAGLYLVHAASGATQRLTGLDTGPPGPAVALSGGPADLPLQSLSWSPDGTSVAFVDRATLAAPFSVYAWSVGKAQKTRLTWPPAFSLGDGSPAFSRAGDKLAFVRWRDAFSGDIYLVSLAGGNPMRLTSEHHRIRGLTWTPDGRSIVFSSERDGQPNLWRVAASGGAPERVAGVQGSATFPAMAMRDRALVYVRWAGNDDIWRVPIGPSAEGGSATRIDPHPGDNEHPRYSPDGRRVAFSSGRSGDREIWVCDASGAHPVQLTTLHSYSGSPRWSPDGRYIAFDSRHKGNWDIYVIDANGGAPKPVAANATEESRPSWSSDGQWIYFRSDRSGSSQIWKVAAQGGPAVQVTRNGGFEALESPDGRVLYYTRRSIPGLWSVPAQGGEEQLVWKDLPENSRNWLPAREGIYYLGPRREPAAPGAVLQFLRFSSRQLEQVADLPSLRANESGLSASADGRWLLFAGKHEMETDLALLRY